MTESFYAIAYDIVDDRRRSRVAQLLEEYAVRVQYSLFECVLSAPEYARLLGKLEGLVADGDKLRIYPIAVSRCDEIIASGGAPVQAHRDFWLL